MQEKILKFWIIQEVDLNLNIFNVILNYSPEGYIMSTAYASFIYATPWNKPVDY